MTEKTIEQYIEFCRSPLNTPAEIIADYEKLVAQESVLGIGFRPATTSQVPSLVVITDNIDIEHEGETYHIGRFAIYLFRYQDNEGYWFSDFSFRNLTRVISVNELDEDVGYLQGEFHHPHIIEDSDAYDMPIGSLCINKGSFAIRDAIRMGRLSEAVFLLIKILNMYQDTNPYARITLWKTQKGVNNAQHYTT
jgi:hypothetical protein